VIVLPFRDLTFEQFLFLAETKFSIRILIDQNDYYDSISVETLASMGNIVGLII